MFSWFFILEALLHLEKFIQIKFEDKENKCIPTFLQNVL